MKAFALLVLLVGVATCLAAQDQPPDTQAGNFLFHVPNGWTTQQKGDTTFLFPPSPPSGTTTFIGMAANDMEGDLRNSFNELWSGMAKSYRILQGGQAAPLHSKRGYDAFYTTAVAADQVGTRWQVFVMGAQYKKRVQTVMFMSNVPPGSYYNACFNTFQHFLENLSFGDVLPGAPGVPGVPGVKVPSAEAAANPLPDAPHQLPAGALEGFYVGMSLGYGGRVSRNPLYFTPDGWVVKIDLNNSVVGFDVNKYRQDPSTNRSWVGRYRVSGNQINILWQDFTDHRQVIQRNEASANPGLDQYVPMCGCTGKKFSGKYNFGLATAGQYIQFFPDGTFIDHGVTDQMLVPNPYFDRPRTQRGTYSIQSQTITFNFADGHRGTRTFIAPKAQEKGQMFDWIGLGIQSLYEEHYKNEP